MKEVYCDTCGCSEREAGTKARYSRAEFIFAALANFRAEGNCWRVDSWRYVCGDCHKREAMGLKPPIMARGWL